MRTTAMRTTAIPTLCGLLAACALLAGCADGGSAAARARNDHDLSAFGNAGLALQSQVRTDGDNLADIGRRTGAATP